MSNEILLNIKKRNRPSLVCLVCKKRKIKCDKGKPCSSCVKNQIEHLCRYTDPQGPPTIRKIYAPQVDYNVVHRPLHPSAPYAPTNSDPPSLNHAPDRLESVPQPPPPPPNDRHVYVKKQYLDDLTSHMENRQVIYHDRHHQPMLQPPQMQPQMQPQMASQVPQIQQVPPQIPPPVPQSYQLDSTFHHNMTPNRGGHRGGPLSVSPLQGAVPIHIPPPTMPPHMGFPPHQSIPMQPHYATQQVPLTGPHHEAPSQIPPYANVANGPHPVHMAPVTASASLWQYLPGHHEVPPQAPEPPNSVAPMHAVLPSQYASSVSPSFSLAGSRLQTVVPCVDLRNRSLPSIVAPQTPCSTALGHAGSEASESSRVMNSRPSYNSTDTYSHAIIEEKQLIHDFCELNEINSPLANIFIHPFYECPSPSAETKGIAFLHRFQGELEAVPLRSTTLMALVEARDEKGTTGMNPYISEEETINFHTGFNPVVIERSGRRSCAGPLSWSNVKRKDPVLRLINKRLSNTNSTNTDYRATCSAAQDSSHEFLAGTTIKQECCESEPSKEDDSPNAAKNTDPKARIYPHSANEEKQPTNGNKPTIPPNVSQRVLTLDLTLNMTHIGKESKWTDIIQKVIPKRRTIWTLLDLFFERVYTYFPYVDEILFKAQITSIIGLPAYVDEIPRVKIEQRVDLAYIGTLFCILRLTYLYVLPYDDSKAKKILDTVSDTDINKYCLENPIPITLIDVVHACIEHFLFVRKLSLPVFQCCWYFRLYQIHAPEEGVNCDPAASQIAHSNLVGTAYAIGLNREPSIISDYALSPKEAHELKDERTRNLCRKLWYSLYFVDHQQNFNEGCYPIRITSSDYDVQLPRFSVESSNTTNLNLEKQVMQVYAFWELCADGPIAKILKLVLPMNRDVKVQDVMRLLSHGEVNVLNVMGTFDDYLTVLPEGHPKAVVRVGALSLLMFNYSVFLSIYLLFLVHYNDKSNYVLEYYYILKLYENNVLQSFPYFLKLVYEVDDIYGRGAGMMLLPQIIIMIVRTIECLLIGITRANTLLYNRYSIPEKKYEPHHQEKLEIAHKILNYSEKVARILLFALTKVMTKYYIAWKNYKTLLFVLDMITKESFYADADPLMEKLVSQTPFYEAKRVVEICDKSYDKFLEVSKTIKELDLNDLLEKITRSSVTRKDPLNHWGTPVNSVAGTQAKRTNTTVGTDTNLEPFNQKYSKVNASLNSNVTGNRMAYSDQRQTFPAPWNRNYPVRPPMQTPKLTSDIGVYEAHPMGVSMEHSMSHGMHNDSHQGNNSVHVVASDYQNIPIANGEAIDSRWLQLDTFRKTKTGQFDSMGPFSSIGGSYSEINMPFLSDMHNDDFIDQIYTNRYMLVDVENLGRLTEGLPFTSGITSDLNAELFTDMA